MQLARELKVNVRQDWTPDANWLGSFQKIQLADLVTELKGKTHTPDPQKKESDLVEQLAKLFADAEMRKLDDRRLAAKFDQCLPANLREPKPAR